MVPKGLTDRLGSRASATTALEPGPSAAGTHSTKATATSSPAGMGAQDTDGHHAEPFTRRAHMDPSFTFRGRFGTWRDRCRATVRSPAHPDLGMRPQEGAAVVCR